MGDEKTVEVPVSAGRAQRPKLGVLIVLVYREAPCGCWCATGEGDYAPLCGQHGEAMVPVTGGEVVCDPLETGGGPWDSARLGFAAELRSEAEVVREVQSLRQIGAG